MKSKLKVGVDFDGVLAYNPFRIIRAPITYTKRQIFGESKTHFFVPQTELEKMVWGILHESSIFPASGIDLLRTLASEQRIEAHLITARFSYLQTSLYRWLNKYNLKTLFTSITLNEDNEQPHIYKEKIVRGKKLDFYIEDNWDIVEHVAPRTETNIYWIYNILDRNKAYPHKYANLRKALEALPI